MSKKSESQKKKKISIILGISVPVLVLTITIPPIAIVATKTQEIVFKKSDLYSLKNNLSNVVKTHKLTLDKFQENISTYFKSYLVSNNKSVGNLIRSVQIISNTPLSIQLSLDANNKHYFLEDSLSNIQILNNTLIITFDGDLKIDFY